MASILEMLQLDQTVFVEFAFFIVLFALLSRIYFKPFLTLFEARHQRTVADRQAAEKMLSEAQTKLAEYQRRLLQARQEARAEYEKLISNAKKEEAEIFSQTREEVKKITQDAVNSAKAQREQLRKELSSEVDALANAVSEKLLVKKG